MVEKKSPGESISGLFKARLKSRVTGGAKRLYGFQYAAFAGFVAAQGAQLRAMRAQAVLPGFRYRSI
jgi:hypothetical protein